ncbi:Uncharacterised protein [Pandoraea pnomenusa]|uniref:Uncharacterized protein n=2 Tax=Pandoraea pnomenusa TaxID=93220 RepID=A0A378Y9G5_9BURK|nr:Uncharacterised protein [Pandoraea pnomenusa]
MRGLIGACLLSVTTIAVGQGNNCDCQQIVGTCAVSVSVIPTESTKGSYGADLKFTSSAPICSKVDYYVDGTPYFTILSQGNRGEDRVFGQKPITRANLSSVSCQVCKRAGAPTDNSGRAASADQQPQKIDLSGTWNSVQTCSYGSGTSTMTITQANPGDASISGNLSNAKINSGRIEGSVVTIQASNWLGNQIQMEGRVIGAGRISGTYTQTATAGVCQWEATKM